MNGDWEKVKENIRPLKQGRKMALLSAGLSSNQEVDDKIEVTKKQFEDALANDFRQGSTDVHALPTWERYLSWIEQAYPNGGRQQLETATIRCLKGYMRLEPAPEKLKNSHTFLNICLKFIHLKQNPLQIFDYLESNGYFQELALFYESWAAVLELKHNWTRAKEIYCLGIHRNAEPTRRLQRHYYEFMARESQRMEEKQAKPVVSDGGDERSTLVDLRMSKRGYVGTIRTGVAVSAGQGGIRSTAQQQLPTAASKQKSHNLHVYQDENMKTQPQQLPRLPMRHFPDSSHTKENTQKPSKWPKAKIGRANQQPVKQPSISTGFQAYKDPEENDGKAAVGTKLHSQCKALKETKLPAVPNNPLINEVYFHPDYGYTRVSMDLPSDICLAYDHKVIYPQGRGIIFHPPELDEVSFEELRALLPKYTYNEDTVERHDDSLEFTCVVGTMQKAEDAETGSDVEMEEVNPTEIPCAVQAQHREGTITRCLQFKDDDTASCLSKPSSTTAVQPSPVSCHTDSQQNSSNRELVTLLHNSVSVNKDGTGVRADPTLDDSYLNLSTQQLTSSKLSIPNPPEYAVPEKVAILSERAEEVPKEPNQMSEEMSPNLEKSPTMTIYTRNAMEAVQKMFDCSLALDKPAALTEEQKSFEDQFKLSERVGSPNPPVFSVFCDKEGDDDRSTAIGNVTDIRPSRILAGKMSSQGKDTSTSVVSAENQEPFEETKLSIRDPKVSTPCDVNIAMNWSISRIQSQKEACTDVVDKRRAYTGPQLSPVPEVDSKENSSGSSSKSLSDSPQPINPFSETFLTNVTESIPGTFWQDNTKYYNCEEWKSDLHLNKLDEGTFITLGDSMCQIEKKIGKGRYASVYLAKVVENDNKDEYEDNQVAVKVQTPPHSYEFYVLETLQERLQTLQCVTNMRQSIMSVQSFTVLSNVSFLVSKFYPYGTLLDVVNCYRSNLHTIPESIAMFYTIEILKIIDVIHFCGILHCDVKPDNFLIIHDRDCSSWSETYCSNGSSGWAGHGLQLIDFGRAIDMQCLPAGTTFRGQAGTNDFECIEMRQNMPWTKQFDMYGIAATIHCLIYNEYLKADSVYQHPQTGRWVTTKKPKRNWQRGVWLDVFDSLLNVPSCEDVPPLRELYGKLENELIHTVSVIDLDELQQHCRELSAYLK